jgi:hypothetical protein
MTNVGCAVFGVAMVSASDHDKETIKSHNRKSIATDILGLTSSAIIDDGIIINLNKEPIYCPISKGD